MELQGLTPHVKGPRTMLATHALGTDRLTLVLAVDHEVDYELAPAPLNHGVGAPQKALI